jgi:hypothetical protein
MRQSVARPKRVETSERQTVTVRYSVVPYFAVSCSDPKLSGITGVGRTAREALTHMRAAVRDRYPLGEFDIIEKTDTPEMMLATSWREPVYE